jgi:hypothetical protein
VTETPPDDAVHNTYSRRALARLVLSDHAAGVSDAADSLVITRYDVYAGPGGRVSEAQTLTRLAARVLADAVVYEREHGSSWEDIGRYLGVSATTAEERFTPDLDHWASALETPYRLDESGRRRVLQLPSAAHDPDDACRRLDLRAHLRLGLREDDRAVSAALFADDASDKVPDPEVHEMSGWIWHGSLEPFLGLLARYIRYDAFDATDWNTVRQGLEGTDDVASDGWYAYPLNGPLHSVNVRMARSTGGDEVSVVVAGAVSAELRLRIDTLMAAFSAHDRSGPI